MSYWVVVYAKGAVQQPQVGSPWVLPCVAVPVLLVRSDCPQPCGYLHVCALIPGLIEACHRAWMLDADTPLLLAHLGVRRGLGFLTETSFLKKRYLMLQDTWQ